VQWVLPAHMCPAEPLLPFCRSANRLWSIAANTDCVAFGLDMSKLYCTLPAIEELRKC
jgi:hypothetical protein